MTAPNPFAPAQPATPPVTEQANPYAQPQQQAAPAPQAAPAAGNPFAPQVPQQQPQAPQAYAPQQAPAAAPQYGVQAGGAPAPQWLAQQAAPTQQQAPAAQVPSGPPPALNASGLVGAPPPPPNGDGKGARLADMYGRLVLVFPLSLTRRPRNPQFVTPEQRAQGRTEEDLLTATIVVLDDGQGGVSPIAFGGKPYAMPPSPHTESAALPYIRKAMWISQSKLVGQLRDSLPAGAGAAPQMVCGRVMKAGPNHNDPWYLQGANEQELAHAGAYLNLVAQGTYPHPLAN